MFNYNVHSDIIHSYSSKLIFSNFTLFRENKHCNQLIDLKDKFEYIILKDNATLQIINNDVKNEVVSVANVYNHPFRHCMFQFISNSQDNFHNFHVILSPNREHEVDSKRGNSTLNKLTAHCKWIKEMPFRGIDYSVRS